MQLFSQYQDIFLSLSDDALLITPNQRLSRFVHNQHSLWLSKSENSVWASLNCLSWNTWLAKLWDDVQLSGLVEMSTSYVMTATQERVLWEQLVEDSTDERFLSSSALADSSKQAWAYLRKWRQCLGDVSTDTEEFSLLKQWVATYREITGSFGLLDNTQVLELLIELICDNETFKLPPQIIFIGFDEIPPLDQYFIDTVIASGSNVQFCDVKLPSNCTRVELADTSVEISTMMQWAAAIVEKESDVSVGLVVPNLAELRPTVERVYLDVFEPQYKFSGAKRHAPSANISAGQPLAQLPLIATALLCLKFNKREIDIDELYTILSSPFMGVASERACQIKLLSVLRAEYKRVPIAALKTSIAKKSATGLTELHQKLLSFENIQSVNRNKKQKPSCWAEVFYEQLLCLGWPGERTLDTLEYQQLSHWPDLLAELSDLDLVLAEIDVNRALAELNKIAYVPFHAKTLDSPIQILGLLEAAGQQFDYLWVMGMDYRAWPEACKPNPMLPVSFQRQIGMPRSSNEKELKLAEKLTARLSNSAATVVFSSSTVEGDQPLRVSPLIEPMPLINLDELDLFLQPTCLEVIAHSRSELLDERIGPPVDAVKAVKGGAQVLKDQGACPFRAFAKHRLKAENREVFQEGVSPLMRGNLLHGALERIWMQLEGSAQLIATEPNDYEQMIVSAILSSWKKVKESHRVGAAFRQIETRRSTRLVKQWLEIEKRRSPFIMVASEESIEFDISGIPLRLRLDRIDRLEDTQELIVIDYKTGVVDVKLWAGDRPDDPQVPLYCVALKDRKVIAAVFAQINGKEVSAKGISSQENVIPGVRTPKEYTRIDLPEDWDTIQDFWASNLERLGSAFIAGEAAVNPKSINTTCLHCDLKSLCRVAMVDS